MEYRKMQVLSWVIMCLSVVVCDASCPSRCRCQYRHHRGWAVDCSSQRLRTIPTHLYPDTAELDLSNNRIATVPRHAFSNTRNISILNLEHNVIETIEPYAFKGLDNLEHLNLSDNNILELKAESMAHISGKSNGCGQTKSNLCLIDLTANNLQVIETNAFASMAYMSVSLGWSETELLIQKYAFYLARDLGEIRISKVPKLTLQARLFTDVDGLRSLRISDTRLDGLSKFTFEGLQNVQLIHFDNCTISTIAPYGFSGINYATENPAAESGKLKPSGGGVIAFTASTFFIPTDGFRDTNLVNISIHGSTITAIHPYGFRGLTELNRIDFTNNTLESIDSHSFGALRNMAEIRFHQNKIGVIRQYAFDGLEGVSILEMTLIPNSTLTLESYAFANVLYIDSFQIIGQTESRVEIEKDAFNNMLDVREFHIRNLTLPVVKSHTFRGLSRVKLMNLTSCNISEIEEDAFGSSMGVGNIETLDISHGNNLQCDCNIREVVNEFENTFSYFKLMCSGVSDKEIVQMSDMSDIDSLSVCTNDQTNTKSSAFRTESFLLYALLPTVPCILTYIAALLT